MYQEGASNILTALTDLDPKIRDTVLEALSAYHQAFDNNNAVVEQVAKVLLR